MSQTKHKSPGWVAVALLAGAGCIPEGAAGPKRPRVAALPVESESFPDLAKSINDGLRDLHVKGKQDFILSKVTLEVVQLSIECVEATAACYSAVGRNLSVERLLLSQVSAVGAQRRGNRSVKVSLTLFDVDKGVAVTSTDKQFKSADEASAAVAGLLEETLGTARPPAVQGGR